MKIGIIAQGRNCADVLDKVIEPWTEASEKYDIQICLVSSTFKEMKVLGEEVGNSDSTWEKFRQYADMSFGKIDCLTFTDYTTEAESRNAAKNLLLSKRPDLDYIWMLDLSDEYYTIEQIDKIITFIKSEPFTAWFRLSFKNYVFDKNTFLTAPFTPPRIWRVKISDYTLGDCVYDNDFSYTTKDGKKLPDKTLSNYIVPKSVAWIKHYSWLNDERGKLKCAYQNIHFGSSGCSYIWDEKNGLQFNDEYFKKHGIIKPSLLSE